jgi:hypothetical protein
MYRHRVIKNDKLIKAWIKHKLLNDLGLMKERSLYTDIFQASFSFSLKHLYGKYYKKFLHFQMDDIIALIRWMGVAKKRLKIVQVMLKILSS